jgi:hypothetical protein
MTTYNGHKNWNHWNVSLWINNDEGLYNMARQYARRYRNAGGKPYAAQAMLNNQGRPCAGHPPLTGETPCPKRLKK